MELEDAGLTAADVFLAVGLPLKWAGSQKEAFRAYLLQNETVTFAFHFKQYTVRFVGCEIYPQGYAAIFGSAISLPGTTMLCDIGNGTMSIMYINNGKPVSTKSFTEKYGTHQCTLAAREMLMRKCGVSVDDDVIEAVLRYGEADIGKEYLDVIRQAAKEYAAGIMRRLREHEYNPALMKLYVVGGGGCLIQNFTDFDPGRVTINDDICATAKGYERLAQWKLEGQV
jgi:plasmid segregation protein ParM